MIALAAVPEGVVPLAVGTALALASLSLVLAPLLSDEKSEEPAPRRRRAVGETDAPASDGAVEALREIEFDRATGKLSDADYLDLKQRYTQAAIDELRALKDSAAADDVLQAAAAASKAPRISGTTRRSIDGAGETSLADESDPVEAAIQRARATQKSCEVCGPRPEPDAAYCSSCGGYLDKACKGCGAAVDLAGSRFCAQCGEQLAAV